jgi:hypothetical protein
MGFVRGENERSCFYHADRDLLVLLYVDDCLADGDAADVEWIFTELEERFKCKSADMVTDLLTQDCLGMVIRVEGDRIYMSMAKYIENACRILEITGESWTHGCLSTNPSARTALCYHQRARPSSSLLWECLNGSLRP